MKTNILKIVAIMLMLAGSFASCGNKTNSEYFEPMEIPIMEYSLDGTGCCWTNSEHGKVIVINSSKELEKYIECTDDVDYPFIDFSRFTLLLINEVAYNGVAKVSSTFFKVGDNKYSWKITVRLITAQVAERWHTAILVPKLTNKEIIVIDIQQSH